MKKLMLMTAAAAALIGSKASASVSYTYAGDAGSFAYLAPHYITASLDLPASALVSCTSLSGACSHVVVDFPYDNASVAAVRVYDVDGDGAGTIFGRSDFGADGVYTALYSPTRTLTVATVPVDPTVSAAPEPATWTLMIGGLGVIGAAMRRRTRGDVVVA